MFLFLDAIHFYYRNKNEGKCTIGLKCENQTPLCTCTSKVICPAPRNSTADRSNSGNKQLKTNSKNKMLLKLRIVKTTKT